MKDFSLFVFKKLISEDF